jgi:hemolysin activation/secretion protein
VRGFEPAQETGENGVSFNIDYSHAFHSSDVWSVKAGPFFDGGWVGNRKEGSTLDSNLYSVGLGAEVSVKPFKFGESTLRFDWAHPVGSYKNDNIDNNSFYVRFTQTFVF